MRPQILLSLLSCLSLLEVAPTTARAETDHFRLARIAKPTSQQITLSLDPARDDFSGTAVIELELLKNSESFEVSGRDYQVLNAQLKGVGGICDLSHKATPEAKVTFSCERPLKAGGYTLSVSFTAPFNRKSVGLYKAVHQEVPHLFTQFEMTDARRAFPVFDEPEYKIPFQLTISAPSSQRVYTNTPAERRVVEGEITTHYFKRTPPIPSYLIAIAVGPLEEHVIEGMRVPAHVVTVKGRGELVPYAQETIPKIFNELERYFGIPYAYQKLDSVGVPEFPFGAMENAGLVTYREDLLLLDQAKATSRQKMYHFNVVAHELAHQWYGNLVTMMWWDDLWLNEAFATWLAGKITQRLAPEFNLHLMLPQNYVMRIDARSTTKPIRKPIRTEADVMDGLGLAYAKGSAVLSMVENWIGEESFQRGMRAYMRRFAFKNAVASDLWGALSEASGRDVAAVLKSFVTQSSYPLIKLSIQGEELTLSQSRFAVKGQEVTPQRWTLPVMIKYGRGAEVRTLSILMDQETHTASLEFAPEWIYPDQNAFGYYRWLLPSTLLDRLLTFAPDKLSDRERSALLSSIEALLDAGTLSADGFIATLSRFVSDPHPQVARDALNKLMRQRDIFSTSESRPLWSKLLKLSAEPAIKRYGVTARPDEEPLIAELRSTILFHLGFDAHDAEVLERATRMTTRFLKDPESVDPYLAQTSLSLAASQGDLSLFQAYQERFESPQTPVVRTQLLTAMGFFAHPQALEALLAYALSDHIKPPDLPYLFRGMKSREAPRLSLRAWIKTELSRVIRKLPPYFIPYLPSMISGGCDKAELQATQALFEPQLKAHPELKRALEKHAEQVHTCVSQRERELNVVNEYLKRL